MFYKSLLAFAYVYSCLLGLRTGLLSGRSQRRRWWMQRFIGGNLCFVLQREPNVVQSIQQTVTHEFIDGKFRTKALFVPHLTLLQVDVELVIVKLARSPHQFGGFRFAHAHREEAVLGAVIGKDVGERRGNLSAETKNRQSPHRVLTRRTTANILSRNQNACAFITRFVQNKTSALLSVGGEPPVIKQKLPKAGALNSLQKLFRDDLVGVNIDPVQRSHAPTMCTKRFHIFEIAIFEIAILVIPAALSS